MNDQTKLDIYHNFASQVEGPGKFEGEQPYVPYFWESYMNGFANDDGHVLQFDVGSEAKAIFPELHRRRSVRLIETDNGFVCEV